MPASSRSSVYELMIKSLLQTHLDEAGLGSARAFHLKKYRGKSGQEHEIDISFEIDAGGMELLLLVECKEYSRRVGKDVVEAFAYRLRDIGAHKGLLVTTTGFQAGAITLAKAERIALLTAMEGRRVQWWLGTVDETDVLWTRGFTLLIQPATRELQLIGRRHVVHNESWQAVPLGEAPRRDAFLYFVLPDEMPDFAPGVEGAQRIPVPPEGHAENFVII